MNTNVPPYGQQPPYAEQPPYSGPYYGQSPYAQQPPPPPLPGSSSRWGPTTLGIDPALAAGLAYLFGGHVAGIIPIIWLVVEKRNRFIRFNAAQALLLIAAFLVGTLFCGLLFVGGAFLTAAGVSAAQFLVILSVVLFTALSLALLVCSVWGIIAGFTGTFVKFPLVGNLAVRLVGGPPVPLW